MALEREAELFAKLDLMLEIHRRMERDVQDLRERTERDSVDLRDRMERNTLDLRGEMRGLQSGMVSLADRVSRLEGRIEEQSKMLQLALAARQPRTGAA